MVSPSSDIESGRVSAPYNTCQAADASAQAAGVNTLPHLGRAGCIWSGSGCARRYDSRQMVYILYVASRNSLSVCLCAATSECFHGHHEELRLHPRPKQEVE